MRKDRNATSSRRACSHGAKVGAGKQGGTFTETSSILLPLTDPTALLSHLWRGGSAAYFWCSISKQSQWMSASQIVDSKLGNTDVYFGVHPTCTQRGEFERGHIPDVECVNCLFAEFDAKDFNNDIALVRKHIESLFLQPQVVVFSGGGYHCYWLLAEPVKLAGMSAPILIATQRAWVRFAGGDGGAKDLARVLRLPGTLNAKYDPPRQVQFVQLNLNSFYTFEELRQAAQPYMLNVPSSEPLPARGPIASIVASYKQAHVGERNSYLLWAACRLYDYGMSFAGVRAELLPIALSQGLTEQEVIATLRSASKQPRRPISMAPQRPTSLEQVRARFAGVQR